MTNEEIADKVLETFDHAEVATRMRFTDLHEQNTTSSGLKARARDLLLELLAEPPETHSIETGGLIVVRNGSRLGIGYVLVHSLNFP